MNQIIGIAPKALCSNCRVHKSVTMKGPWHLCSWCAGESDHVVGAQAGPYEIVGEDPNVTSAITIGLTGLFVGLGVVALMMWPEPTMKHR